MILPSAMVFPAITIVGFVPIMIGESDTRVNVTSSPTIARFESRELSDLNLIGSSTGATIS